MLARGMEARRAIGAGLFHEGPASVLDEKLHDGEVSCFASEAKACAPTSGGPFDQISFAVSEQKFHDRGLVVYHRLVQYRESFFIHGLEFQ